MMTFSSQQPILFATLWATMAAIGLTGYAQDSSLLHAPPPRSTMPIPPLNEPGQVSLASPPQLGVPQSRPAGQESEKSPLMLDRVSWTHQPAPPIRTFRKYDVVTIRVDEITRVMAEGSAESRKRTQYFAALTEWIRLTDFRLRPDPQANGDPSIGTNSNNNYRAEASVESRESMTFNIAATVVDIRPNGLLVLEARKQIRVNDNLWETSLTGICRGQDIAPDNVVLSKDLIDLEIRKDDRGHLRDGYKRGWFQRWFDRVQPF
jgi:flagellar L-ring protein precursor FlgH